MIGEGCVCKIVFSLKSVPKSLCPLWQLSYPRQFYFISGLTWRVKLTRTCKQLMEDALLRVRNC